MECTHCQGSSIIFDCKIEKPLCSPGFLARWRDFVEVDDPSDQGSTARASDQVTNVSFAVLCAWLPFVQCRMKSSFYLGGGEAIAGNRRLLRRGWLLRFLSARDLWLKERLNRRYLRCH